MLWSYKLARCDGSLKLRRGRSSDIGPEECGGARVVLDLMLQCDIFIVVALDAVEPSFCSHHSDVTIHNFYAINESSFCQIDYFSILGFGWRKSWQVIKLIFYHSELHYAGDR